MVKSLPKPGTPSNTDFGMLGFQSTNCQGRHRIATVEAVICVFSDIETIFQYIWETVLYGAGSGLHESRTSVHVLRYSKVAWSLLILTISSTMNGASGGDVVLFSGTFALKTHVPFNRSNSLPRNTGA